jgi:hypothetical protein
MSTNEERVELPQGTSHYSSAHCCARPGARPRQDRAIEQSSDDVPQVRGSLHPALHRLIKAAAHFRPRHVRKPDALFYRLTPKGRRSWPNQQMEQQGAPSR